MKKQNQKEREIQLSKFIAKILRHHPESIGLSLDEKGWASIQELITKAKIPDLDAEILIKIAEADEKRRYELDESKTKIRACQGHSIPVDAGWEKKTPPEILYHGSAQKFSSSIAQSGLLARSRLFVHLSGDLCTAINTGSRHGRVVVYRVDAKKMEADGYCFYQARNGVWLTKTVPLQYLEQIDFNKKA